MRNLLMFLEQFVMENNIMIEVVKGNIIKANTDAIVNAANKNLILGGGVAGAILGNGGYIIQEECNQLAPVRTGEVATTGAGNLPHKYVIHAVAPCGKVEGWQGLVKDCISNILKEAEKLKISSVAIPAIGTGIFGLPLDIVADILVRTVKARETELKYLKKVVFVLFDDHAYGVFKKLCTESNDERQ
jgi:O-acetyl-ADP-ribose deacetylase (regulator of RNase III)